jgi:hypothetical protein
MLTDYAKGSAPPTAPTIAFGVRSSDEINPVLVDEFGTSVLARRLKSQTLVTTVSMLTMRDS